MTSAREFLSSLGKGYEMYIERFEDEGWDTTEEISLMELEDFEDLGVKKGHIRRIQTVLKKENVVIPFFF